MKKGMSKKTRYVLAFILAAIGIGFGLQGNRELQDAISGKSSATIVKNQFEKMLQESNTFTQFTDPELGIQFQYPTSWIKTVTKDGAQKAVILETLNNLAQIQVGTVNVSSGLIYGVEQWTPDILFDELKKQLQEIDRTSVVIAGIEGRKAIFKKTDGDSNVILDERAFIKENMMYTVTFIAVENDDLYDMFHPIFERVVDSFQLITNEIKKN